MLNSNNMVAFFVTVLLLLLQGASAEVDSSSLLWPIPEKVRSLSSDVRMLDPGKFDFISDVSSGLVINAFQRYKELIFKSPTPFYPDGARKNVKETMQMLKVQVNSVDETLNQNTDESYYLDTQYGFLTATTVYGMIRGLETFSQLIYQNMDNQFLINSVEISDSPRFKFRASMIDTSRHFLSVQLICYHLDAMAYSKFNVLHWHMVDDQSFPYKSTKYPNLIAGAYDKNHVYSQDDIAMVIKYAKFRGIRVIVEFDTPGHSQSWGKGQSGLLTQCYNSSGMPSGTFGPINPLLDTTWTFLDGLFDELSKVFPDDYLHLGGDEVKFDCWESNPQIQKWMQDNNYTDLSKLEQYYENRILELVASKGKKYILWQDVFDNKVQVMPETVINVWRENVHWQSEMFNVTKAGLTSILSACWYLDHVSYGNDWTQYYLCDPQDFNGTVAQNELVIGGEACLWGEYVDATNFLSIFWPRSCPVAERLWSPKSYNNVKDAYPRLANMRCRLLSRGIPAEPLGPSYCTHEWPGVKNSWK